MHRILLALALVAAPLVAGQGRGVLADPAPGGFMSPNVTWLGTIPIDTPGIGARVLDVDGQRRLYVTGSHGLTIYDVTDPALPLPLGHAVLPHWENEDVSVSDDGTKVVVAGDYGPSYVIDASVVHAPHLAGVIEASEHTITCVVPSCDVAYGRTGRIFDLSDPAEPRIVSSRWKDQAEAQLRAEGVLAPGEALSQRAHDMNVDAAGYVVTDTVPRLMLDVSDPMHPDVVTVGWPDPDKRLAYQHNNIRPRADEWQPRETGDDAAALRPGELLLGTGETVTTLGCGPSAGPFATWSMRDWDRGRPMQPLDVFRPVNGNWADSNPAVNALGCSGHWFTFDESQDIAAASWYENGTRFIHVEPTTGAITEVGYFQPVYGAAFASYWIDDTHVYTIDAGRGIDILRFDPDPAKRPTRAQIDASWLAKVGAAPVPAATLERYACAVSYAT